MTTSARSTGIAAGPLAALVLAGTAGGGDCVTPVNEDCDGAVVFRTVDLPYHDEGLIGCVNDVPDKPYYDIFYRYDCTASAVHVLSMCDSDGDTYIRLYTGGCGFLAGDEFAVDDDGCPGSPPNADPRLEVELAAGTSYWIELGTWRPDAPWGAPNLPFLFDVHVTCDGDVTDDGSVTVEDLVALILAWGTADGAADLDGSGVVDVADLVTLVLAWGPCLG